ncbi:FK506-binding protein 15 [Zootermopsis nevadensis]|uniref:FK506-binding protein 15 n=1 Tax=Zootermopsis nevadensis TaxID=136037 RepID=A0A067QE89_ZOONE|nr:FK506-binding protein 15 [Zootermopsis nevadensis]KDQ71507.1 FK506-binding protein 15 [Zootermopsis nevadensis]
MFRGDDDDDFTQGSSSKLASLFGIGKSSQEGNTSLTYTAPKQPKKGRAESQSVKGQAVGQSSSQTAPSSAKLSIIAVKAVHTYKLADGNYIAQGKLGAAVLGNAASQTYQLLLYKGKQQHVTSARISSAFQFVVQANNYATFYDDQMQNWSVMFESSDDAVEFAKEVGLARVNAVADQTDHKLVVQDLLSGVGSAAGEGDVVDVCYIAYPLTAGMLGQEVANTTKSEKPQRAKLRKGSWEEGLLGVAKGCKRMIMLPPFLVVRF